MHISRRDRLLKLTTRDVDTVSSANVVLGLSYGAIDRHTMGNFITELRRESIKDEE